MGEKKYFIDNEPASASDIIKKAKEYDDKFTESEIHQTSVAAHILRKHGHVVR